MAADQRPLLILKSLSTMLHLAIFEFIIKDAKYMAVYRTSARVWNIYGPDWDMLVQETRINQVVSQTRALQHIRAIIKQKKKR
jgi:hypothetical protein